MRAIERRGESALTLAEAAEMTAKMQKLGERQGIQDALRRETALALTVVEIIARHIESMAAAGVALEDIALLRAFPAYLNSAGRLLKSLDAMTPRGSVHDAEVARVQALLSAERPMDDDA